MCYSLPKIWLGRIQKYWDKIMPADYPASSSVFTLKFDTAEITSAVEKFEEEIGTEESVTKDIIPEGTVVSNYIGTYNVDGTPGELTLLCPEKVTSKNVKALHYNAENDEWTAIDDIQIIDNYVWGTLDSFSPIAIIEYRKTIHVETEIEGLAAGKYVVCEGNAVKITESEGVITVLDNTTGVSIQLDEPCSIIGGSADGTPIDKTSVTVIGITTNIIETIFCGSFYYSEDESFTTVNEVNAFIKDCNAEILITGSTGAVRTNNVNMTVKDCTISAIGAGRSFVTAKKKDVNESNCSFASRAWVKNSKMHIENVVCPLTYVSGDSGYLYVDSNEADIINGKHDYIINSGSNGATKNSVFNVSGANVGIYQSVNRGEMVSCKTNFVNSTIGMLFVGGDTTDKTVTGTTGSIEININAGEGSYNILTGTEAGNLITSEDVERIVKYVKVSRNANVTISEDTKKLLGSKFIIK